VTPAQLSSAVLRTVRRAVEADELSVAVPERVEVRAAARAGQGDFATSVALRLAGPAGRPARQVAEVLRRRLAETPGIARVEIAGPGFLNITVGRPLDAVVDEVLARGAAYGRGAAFAGTRADARAADPRDARAVVTAEAVNALLMACGAEEGVRPGAAPEELRALEARLGRDAARWALLRPPAGDPVRVDGARGEALLAQVYENPLFRVRYAHARAKATVREAAVLNVLNLPMTTPHPTRAEHHPTPTDDDLLAALTAHPALVENAARHRAPDRLARHLERVADALLRHQERHPPLPKGDEEPGAAHTARVRLAAAAGTVLAGGLGLLGISAPDRL
jgi:arginyl-tRNA synthetase